MFQGSMISISPPRVLAAASHLPAPARQQRPAKEQRSQIGIVKISTTAVLPGRLPPARRSAAA